MIKIIQSSRHFAQNGPTGITIHTGTRYFAAVLLQEWYEFTRYAAWFYAFPVILGAAAALAFGLPFALLGLLAMVLVAIRVLPMGRAERELNGQAVEIAAIKLFYKRENMDSEYRLQARSITRDDSSYSSFIGKTISPYEYTNEMAIAGEPNPVIDAMVTRLKKREIWAESYVKNRWSKLVKWRPLGAESNGY